MEKKFPDKLYVQEPIDEANSPFEGYQKLEGMEEDDTVAVYTLEGVYRVKIEKRTMLIPEKEMASYAPILADQANRGKPRRG